MTAAVSSAPVAPAAVKPAASTVKATAAVKAATTMDSTAETISAPAAASENPTVAVAAAITISTAVITTAAPATSPVPVVPRTGADEHATREPVRAVEAIGRAGIRVIVIVAISAGRRPAVVARPNPDA